jgi:hypothetical protein
MIPIASMMIAISHDKKGLAARNGSESGHGQAYAIPEEAVNQIRR